MESLLRYSENPCRLGHDPALRPLDEDAVNDLEELLDFAYATKEIIKLFLICRTTQLTFHQPVKVVARNTLIKFYTLEIEGINKGPLEFLTKFTFCHQYRSVIGRFEQGCLSVASDHEYNQWILHEFKRKQEWLEKVHEYIFPSVQFRAGSRIICSYLFVVI